MDELDGCVDRITTDHFSAGMIFLPRRSEIERSVLKGLAVV
jgi:hypothetical protein